MDTEKKETESESSQEKLAALLDRLRLCRQCRERFGFEPHPIAWGKPGAKIMHISQAPSLKVHELGRPFADLSGKRLRQQWYWVSEDQFYDQSLFYFTTMGHCFPGKGKSGGDKKPPRLCYDQWTSKEIEYMQTAQLYLIIGQEAAARLFPGRALEELVFQDLELNGKPCFVLPHPSPLNMNWFRDHPDFMEKRIPVIRRAVHAVIGDEEDLNPDWARNLPSRESWQKQPAKKETGKASKKTNRQ